MTTPESGTLQRPINFDPILPLADGLDQEAIHEIEFRWPAMNTDDPGRAIPIEIMEAFQRAMNTRSNGWTDLRVKRGQIKPPAVRAIRGLPPRAGKIAGDPSILLTPAQAADEGFDILDYATTLGGNRQGLGALSGLSAELLMITHQIMPVSQGPRKIQELIDSSSEDPQRKYNWLQSRIILSQVLSTINSTRNACSSRAAMDADRDIKHQRKRTALEIESLADESRATFSRMALRLLERWNRP